MNAQKKYYEKHKTKILAHNRQYYFKHKNRIRIWNNQYQLRRSKIDTLYGIRRSLRRRFLLALDGTKKCTSIINLLGCSIDNFKQYIESKFMKGMNWNNHGTWHLDHIIPCSYFDLTIVSQQAQCFHYTNFQPLWAKDNLKKGKKLCGTNQKNTSNR